METTVTRRRHSENEFVYDSFIGLGKTRSVQNYIDRIITIFLNQVERLFLALFTAVSLYLASLHMYFTLYATSTRDQLPRQDHPDAHDAGPPVTPPASTPAAPFPGTAFPPSTLVRTHMNMN